MKLTFYYDSDATFTATSVVEWEISDDYIRYAKRNEHSSPQLNSLVTYSIPIHDVRGLRVKDGNVTSIIKLKKNCTVVAGIIK